MLCYNFMPVVDWTRTNLHMELEDGARALCFDMVDFVAFDVFILRRKGAEEAYSAELQKKAQRPLREYEQ